MASPNSAVGSDAAQQQHTFEPAPKPPDNDSEAITTGIESASEDMDHSDEQNDQVDDVPTPPTTPTHLLGKRTRTPDDTSSEIPISATPVSTPSAAKSTKPETGVIYLCRVPPGMDTTSLRALLSRVGPTRRLWLRPFSNDTDAEKSRMSHHNRTTDTNQTTQSRRRRRRRHAAFRDGWVEFTKRRDAKRAVALLNGRPMLAGKHRGRWGDDLWAIRFLRGFTWDDLAREVFGHRRERVLKVREEVAGARRERAWVEGRYDLARRIARKEAGTDEGLVEGEGGDGFVVGGEGSVAGAGAGTGTSAGKKVKVVRRFRQRGVVEDVDEVKARLAAAAVDKEMETGVGHVVDAELLGKLFKKRRV